MEKEDLFRGLLCTNSNTFITKFGWVNSERFCSPCLLIMWMLSSLRVLNFCPQYLHLKLPCLHSIWLFQSLYLLNSFSHYLHLIFISENHMKISVVHCLYFMWVFKSSLVLSLYSHYLHLKIINGNKVEILNSLIFSNIKCCWVYHQGND